MIYFNAAVLTLLTAALVVHIWRKERLMSAIRAHLERMDCRENQIWDLLEVVKSRQESARIEHKEAGEAKADAVATAAELTRTVEAKTAELVTEIQTVPPKVVQLIEEKKEGDSKNDLPAVRPAKPADSAGGKL